jgi:heme/copper-type cytochrome/quinol oxidase subunit 1
MVSGIVFMVGNLLYALLKGPKAPANPWGGTTLEWRVPSPPPVENFEEIPVVTGGPYVHTRPTYIMHPSKELTHGNGNGSSTKSTEEAVH